MEFDELKESWKSQPIETSGESLSVNDNLVAKFRKQQRRVLWSNVFTTIGFIGVFCLFAQGYFLHHNERSAFYGGSIITMVIVMLVYLWVIWKGLALKRMDLTLASKDYLDKYLATLSWRKKLITTYSWIYVVSLWLALMFYMTDVLHSGTFLLHLAAMGGTTVYIFGMQIRNRLTSGKRQLVKLKDLIEEIELLKVKLAE